MTGDGGLVHVVDVGMPTRGEARYLREAVESVLAQTFEDWRLVVSENATTADNAQRLLSDLLGDGRVEIVATGAPSSAAANHTSLVGRSRARYSAILHDDDRWDSSFLERRVAFLAEHPECGFVFGGHRLIDERGDLIRRVEHDLAEGVQSPAVYAPMLARGLSKPKPPTVLVRRAAYDAVGAYYDERYPGFDWEMWIRLAARFPAGYLAVTDADFRLHDGQLTYTERWGPARIQFARRIHELLVAVPGLDGEERARQYRRDLNAAYFAAAADSASEGRAREAVSHLARAVAQDRRSFANPRLPVILVALLLGERGRELLNRVRGRVRGLDYLAEGRVDPDAAARGGFGSELVRRLLRR